MEIGQLLVAILVCLLNGLIVGYGMHSGITGTLVFLCLTSMVLVIDACLTKAQKKGEE